MNFLCDQCKQKYHVADEKVRGKAVTRFKCKKCGHVIELRMAGSSDLPPAPNGVEVLTAARELPPSVPPPAPTNVLPSRPGAAPLPARPAPRPMGGALPAAARLPASPSPAALKAPPAPTFGAPRAAAAPLPTRSPALAAKPAPAPAPSARAATGTALPTAGALGVRAPAPTRSPTGIGMPAAAARPAAFGGSSPLRSGLAGRSDSSTASGPARAMSSASMLLNASETGWYAGVRDVPVGPLTRGELATRIESGDISHDTLVWREGLDDWRPLRSVDELADLVRTAARKMSDGLLGTMGARRNDSGSAKIVPMQPRSTASASTSSRPATNAGHEVERDDEVAAPDDEPTRMTALADLVAKAEQAGLLTDKPATASASSGPSVRPQQARAPSVRPAAAPMPPSTMPLAAAASAPPAATSAPPAVLTAPIPLVAPAPAVVAIAAPFMAPVPAPSAAVVSVAPSTAGAVSASETTQHLASPPAPSRERKLGGLPIGAWVMMVGVLVAGVAIGLALRAPSAAPQIGQPTTTQASTNIAAGPLAPIQRTVGQDLVIAPSDLHPAPPPAAAETAVAPTPHTTAHGPGVGTAPPHVVGPGPAVHQLTAAQRAALAQLDREGSGPGAPAGGTLSNPSASEAPSAQSSQQRASSVIEALGRTNVISNCWNAALRRNAAHPAESVRVQISVLPNGRPSAIHVLGAQDPDLASCVEQRARGGFYGIGAATDAEVRANLALGQ